MEYNLDVSREFMCLVAELKVLETRVSDRTKVLATSEKVGTRSTKEIMMSVTELIEMLIKYDDEYDTKCYREIEMHLTSLLVYIEENDFIIPQESIGITSVETAVSCIRKRLERMYKDYFLNAKARVNVQD